MHLASPSRNRWLGCFLSAFALGASAAQLDLVPDAVVGKNSFTETFTGFSASQTGVPKGLAEDPVSGELWVADSGHRVLRFASAAAYTGGQAANLVLGQVDFTSSQANRGGATAANTLRDPRALAVNQLGHVYVADAGNHRVLVFRPPFGNGMNAAVVIGQADFAGNTTGTTSSRFDNPFGVALDRIGNLFVADNSNARVMRFDAPHFNGAMATFEFKGVPTDPNPERRIFGEPSSVAIDAAGDLWVADFVKSRVVRYRGNEAQADTVLCQANYTDTGTGSTPSKCGNPIAVATDAEGSIYVVNLDGRTMRFPPSPPNGAAATDVIAGNFFSCDLIAPSTTPCAPTVAMVDRRGNLHLADTHARVLRYDLPRIHPVPQVTSLSPATVPVGTAFTLTVNGSGFDAGAVVTWDGQPRTTEFISPHRVVAQIPAGDPATLNAFMVAVANPAPGGGVSNTTPFTPYARGILDGNADRFLLAPSFVSIDQSVMGEELYGRVNAHVAAPGSNFTGKLLLQPGTERLFLSDGPNSRILSWPSAGSFRNAQPADLVIGQADMYGTECNRGPGGARSAATLCSPMGMAFDAQGALYVADGFNNRVLKFAPPFTSGMAASVVFGQGGSFTTGTSNLGADPAGWLAFPASVAVSEGALWVYDNSNRVLRRYSDPDHVQLSDLRIGTATTPCPVGKFCFGSNTFNAIAFDAGGRLFLTNGNGVRRFSPPFQEEQLPDLLLGSEGGAGVGPTGLASPRNLAFDRSGALLVSDTGNNRVLRFEPPFTTGMAAIGVLGQPDLSSSGSTGLPARDRLSSPSHLAVDFAGNVYVVDLGLRVLAFDVPFAPAPLSGDFDDDGIPNNLEAGESRNPWTKDNDIFGNTRLFAMQQYRDFLAREGDATGVNFWTGQMNTGAQNRTQMVETYFNSAEFQGTVAPVARLYFAYFRRVPDYGGLNFWVNQYRTGSALVAISDAFAASPEFGLTYGSLDNGQFVDRVYRNVLGRAPDTAGLAYWTGQINGGMTRGQMMVQFSESPEYAGVIGSEVFVTMIYMGMLRREPDAGGFTFWVAQRDAGSGAALIDAFLASQEYRNRFLP